MREALGSKLFNCRVEWVHARSMNDASRSLFLGTLTHRCFTLLKDACVMSALHRLADVSCSRGHVRFVPKAVIL